MPSKLENPAKRGHGIPFSPSAQTALNVRKTVICTECRRPWLVYAKAKFKDTELRALKRALNSYNYVGGSMFQEIVSDQGNSDGSILTKVFIKENLSCNSMMELPYYTCKVSKNICVYCGKS